MATADIVIKTEPVDENFPVIKQEELIIKPEPDDESLQNTQVLESELQNSFDLLIPKEEPVDDEYLNENSPPVENDEQKEDPPEGSNNLMQCDDCKGYFAGARGLSIHRRLRCRNNHVCIVCGQVFLTFLILQEHLRRHKQKSSPSKETKTTPPTRRTQPKLAKTSPPDSEGVLFTCVTCELTFRNERGLMNHNRIHGGVKHICNQCGKSFKYAVHLNKHKKGNTCIREAIADVLRDNGSDINIKEEVLSEDSEHENLTDQMSEVITDVQGNSFEIKKEEFITDDTVPVPGVLIKQEPIVPGVLIKQEPVVSEENSNDTQGFDDLILHELIDRKAKSIAKERKAIKRSLPPVEEKYLKQTKDKKTLRKKTLSLGNTDFEDIISSSTLSLEINKQEIDKCTFKAEFLRVEPSILDESSQAESRQADDFEEMIASNTLPNYQNKTDVIESLKKEYQKAKKKKLDEVSTDESSQHSSSAATMDVVAPSSVYFSLMGDPEPYNDVVRNLDKNYRYTWICPSCPRRYVQRHAFVKHLTNTHFTEKNDLNNVLFELRPELFYPSTSKDTYCHLCRVTLADAVSLRKHRHELHKEDNTTKIQFKCDKCGKICSTRSTLVDHVGANCGTEPQYGCAVCGKKFYTKSTLNLHRTMHTGELPHECRYCNKRFRTRGQLTVHTRTHTGERPFPCKVCEKRFTHRETLIAHLSRHIDMKRYKCYGCQQFFSCISGLKTHRLTRMSTCGQFKLNARPVGPRVRVIKGNVIFEPQPKFNPYQRDKCDENTEKNGDFQEIVQKQENLISHVKMEPISVAGES